MEDLFEKVWHNPKYEDSMIIFFHWHRYYLLLFANSVTIFGIDIVLIYDI